MSKDAKREIKRNSPDKKGRQSQARDRAITWPKQVFIYLLLFPQTILTFDKRKKKEITYCTLNGGGNPLDPNQTTRNSVYNSPELLYVGRDAGQPVNTVDDPVLFDEFRAAFQHHRNCQIAKQSGTCTRWKKKTEVDLLSRPELSKCSPRSHPNTRSFKMPDCFSLRRDGLDKMKLLSIEMREMVFFLESDIVTSRTTSPLEIPAHFCLASNYTISQRNQFARERN